MIDNIMTADLDSPHTVPGRECGKCSLCCNFFAVTELNKPGNTWCKHCRPGKGGCSIYETRPPICRGFACGWLMSDKVGDEWYPLKSHMILSLAVIGDVQTCTVTVDPRHPNAWKEEPYYAQLKMMASSGLRVRSAADIFIVHIRCNGRVWLMTGEDDIDITRLWYVVKYYGSGKPAAVELFHNLEQARGHVDDLVSIQHVNP